MANKKVERTEVELEYMKVQKKLNDNLRYFKKKQSESYENRLLVQYNINRGKFSMKTWKSIHNMSPEEQKKMLERAQNALKSQRGSWKEMKKAGDEIMTEFRNKYGFSKDEISREEMLLLINSNLKDAKEDYDEAAWRLHTGRVTSDEAKELILEIVDKIRNNEYAFA